MSFLRFSIYIFNISGLKLQFNFLNTITYKTSTVHSTLTLAQLNADSDAVWVAFFAVWVCWDTAPLFFTFHRAIPE